MEKIRAWLEKKGYEKWFRRDNLIILVLAGVLLFLIALPVEDEEKEEDASPETAAAGAEDGGFWEASANGWPQEEYASYLEGRLERILSGMDGAGEVEVMITLASSQELVVEKDSVSGTARTDETDSEGGNRRIDQTDRQVTTVYATEGNENSPYVVKRLSPRVEGVVVAADGAGSGTLDRDITEVVQALFGVEAHKVKVVRRK